MNEQELRERIGVAAESLIAPQVGRLFPAAAVAIRYRGESVYSGAFGEVEPNQPPTPNTLFDLGALTELFTATAFLRLVDLGRLWIDTPVNVVLPDVHESVTYWHLLTHTSGLPESINLCKLPDYDSRIAAIEATLLAYPVNARVQHSAVGTMMLGLTVEALTDLPLDQAIAMLVLQPLELHAEYAPLSRLATVAPTDRSLEREARDANARCLDGVAGHAGLFGTASDVAKLAQLYLDSGLFNGQQVLSEAITYEALRSQIQDRGLGWRTDGDGFDYRSGIGSSVVADRKQELIISLMTNRIIDSPDQSEVEALQTRLKDEITRLIVD